MNDETRSELLRWLSENDPRGHACVARIVGDAADENLVDIAREAAMDLEDSVGEAYEAAVSGAIGAGGSTLDWISRLPERDERAVAVRAAWGAGAAARAERSPAPSI